jgi:hypothetical protein
MEYNGKIVYDLYTILGNVKLNISYKIEEYGDDYEITKLEISSTEDAKEMVSFSLEDEMEEIIEQCIKDFAVKRDIMSKEEASQMKIELHRIPKPKLANENYDFSAN